MGASPGRNWPAEELKGRRQKAGLGKVGTGFQKWPGPSSQILKGGQEELHVTKYRGMPPL